MANPPFPPLNLTAWQPTRDTLHLYSKLPGKIRGALTPFQSHWWHVSLHVDDVGLTTPPIPAPNGRTFRLTLSLTRHALLIALPNGDEHAIPLQNQSPASLCEQTLDVLERAGIRPKIDRTPFTDDTPRPYHPPHAEAYRAALLSVHGLFQQFRATLPGERSPVQLWPHHFDLSLVWFSGREADVPAGEEEARSRLASAFPPAMKACRKPTSTPIRGPSPTGCRRRLCRRERSGTPPAGWAVFCLTASSSPAKTLLKPCSNFCRRFTATPRRVCSEEPPCTPTTGFWLR